MTFHDRNARLYETLKGWGLYVDAIPEDDDPTKINRIVVACGLPFQSVAAHGGSEQSAETGIGSEVKRPLVGESIDPAERSGLNVVDFPTKL